MSATSRLINSSPPRDHDDNHHELWNRIGDQAETFMANPRRIDSTRRSTPKKSAISCLNVVPTHSRGKINPASGDTFGSLYRVLRGPWRGVLRSMKEAEGAQRKVRVPARIACCASESATQQSPELAASRVPAARAARGRCAPAAARRGGREWRTNICLRGSAARDSAKGCRPVSLCRAR
jgi:hypothetical protein